MRIRLQTVILSSLALLVLVVLGGITAIGWQVVLGPTKRAVTATPFEKTEARLARGKYLVEGPAHCFHCHSEHDLSSPTYPTSQTKKGAGWAMPIPELNHIAAGNITPDMETGIGSWTDDEVARAIREGVRKDGTALFPVMPYLDYASMDDEDVKAIVVYLRTLAPVRNQVPARNLPFPLEYIVRTIPKPLTSPRPAHPAATPQERGAYLVTLAGCVGCHTIVDDGVPRAGLTLAGGARFDLPGGVSLHSPNISADPSGIQHYDEGLFIEVLRTGSLPGRMLSHIMPFEFFRNTTDDDLRDMFAYLRAQPPVRHRISNTDPPTMCPLCRQEHGLGHLNVAATKGN